jgi:3-oxoacyl-(acyl-carrier-protein) synthase
MRNGKARRAVITGLGPITCIGIGKDAFWRGILAEKSGIQRSPASTRPPFTRTAAARFATGSLRIISRRID